MKRFFLFLAALAILQVPAYAEGDKISCSETAMQYEVTGGRLKRNSDDVTDRIYGHDYTGEIKVGETITIRYAGTHAWSSPGGTDGDMAINPMSSKRRIEGMRKETHVDDGEGYASGHMSYTVEPDVEKIDVYATFTSYIANPMMGLVPYTVSVWARYKVVERYSGEPAPSSPKSGGSNSGPSTSGPSYDDDYSDGNEDPNHEEDNWASVFTDVIPFLIPAAVIGAITGIAVKKGKKKKGNGGNGKTPSTPNKGPEPDEPYYSMHFYKNFGDKIIVGEPPQKVYARIVKVVKGVDTPDQKLTSMISITNGGHLKVVQTGLEGGWMSAEVEALEEDPLPEEGIVVFRLEGNGGSYTNRMHFIISEPGEVVLADESLTFPAGKLCEKHMGFGLNGVSVPPEDIVVKLMDGGESKFKTCLEQDLENPLMFRIFITETCPDKEDAGKVEQYRCSIDVKLQSGRSLPTKIFYIYRMHLGLSMELDVLKAYLVDFHSNFDSELVTDDKAAKKKLAESRVTFKLIVEDKETGQLRNVLPDNDPVITFNDVEYNNKMFADKNGVIIEKPCELIQFKYEFHGILESANRFNEVVWWGLIRPTGGILVPPNRAKAKVTATVTYQGETYSDTVTVPVISQPYRDRISQDEYFRLVKEDEGKMAKLKEMRAKIEGDIAFSELIPYYYKVHAMIEGYHKYFGFYEPDYERLMRVYKKYCAGQIGHYFVNDTVWRTDSELDFDCFLATYGSIEKTWIGLGCRIVIGFITIGKSEVLLTPLSSLVKMRDYVDKGGDSAWEAFSTNSKDVLFWEGVFRAAGMGLGYVNQKYGVGTFLKAKYSVLKESFMQRAAQTALGKRLGLQPSYSTKALGDSIKQTGEQTKAISEAASRNADRAISNAQKAAEAGKGAGAGAGAGAGSAAGKSWAQQCAEKALKDSKKIFDDFTRVMNNPTATKEEMRRATLALQGNKGAQDLLRQSPSDLLRANFNHNIQQIYKEVDQMTIAELAKKLGVKPNEIQLAPNATSNNPMDLFRGKRIGADRDVTYQVLKDGKWVDVEQTLMEQTYARCFTKYNYNFFPPDVKQAIKTLDKFDQAAVNGLQSLESYGADLPRIVDAARRTEKLVDPEMVANAFEYKCKHWINQGKAAINNSEALKAYGLIDEAMSAAGYGQNLIKEGIRQNVKQFKNILLPRMQALKQAGVGKDYSKLLEKINVLERLGVPPPAGKSALSLEEAAEVLSSQYGTTVEQVVEECASIIPEVNQLL